MRVFDIDLSPRVIEEIAAHAERDYPIEACGIVLGRPGTPELSRVVPMGNIQDRYHARDPEAFPRDGKDAFRIDELERMRMLEHAEAEGLTERVLYHSHCDAGAYFSPEDRAMAVHQGIELMPGVVHVVVSIRDRKRSEMAAFRCQTGKGGFDEARVPLVPPGSALPDLELRAMEGREAARPIRPFGGVLGPRRITAEERERIAHLAEKVQVRLDTEQALQDLRRLELGLFSPLSGFLRTVEVRSIEQSGRLLSGVPWRVPVTLEITAKKSAVLPAAGALIELVDPSGAPRAAIGLTEVHRLGRDSVRLAGPVFAYDSGDRGCADSRAEILRRGMKRVLAIGPAFVDAASACTALGEFDGVLSSRAIPNVADCLELMLPGRDPWLDAVMAQNQGATHLWVTDPVYARAIEDTLAIVPWPTGGPT